MHIHSSWNSERFRERAFPSTDLARTCGDAALRGKRRLRGVESRTEFPTQSHF